MVQLWYQADLSGSAADLPLAPYVPTAEAEALLAFYPIPPGAFTAETNSRIGAPVAAGSHSVVFFHHGLCAARTDSTIVAEQLASLGHVVVALGNTHESPLVQFPDGRTVATSNPDFCTAGTDPASPVLQQLLQVRVEDVSFTADALQQIHDGANPTADGAPLPAGLDSALELDRMGIYGHSFGGATAAAVLAVDGRFVAGIDLDGFIIGPVAQQGLDKPFLVVGSSYHDPTFDPTWGTFLPTLTGWHRWFQVTDAGHYRFIDLGGSAMKWGLDTTLKEQDPTTWTQVFGDIDDATSQQINRDLVAGFFGDFLRDESAAVLEEPAALFPNVIDRTAEIVTSPTPTS
ncbi:alpha/beta hydrolase [Variovorax sp. PBS-H4]|uniref:alpha/beta hydrolase n=1 Tax=Variovorax sp. PBS-H4 TaxID=434008 RepID=UPI001E34E8B4|nr:hypothetical protein [Variovorax sp. PBS-H4]